MPACAIEMRMVISQEPIFGELTRKNAGPQGRDNTLTHIWRERAQSKCTWTSQKNIFMQESCRKIAGAQKLAAHFLQACTVDMQWTSDKSHFMQEFPGKMPRLKTRKNSWRRPCRLCASLRNQNGHGHLTRAILCENLKKGRNPDGAPLKPRPLLLP